MNNSTHKQLDLFPAVGPTVFLTRANALSLADLLSIAAVTAGP